MHGEMATILNFQNVGYTTFNPHLTGYNQLIKTIKGNNMSFNLHEEVNNLIAEGYSEEEAGAIIQEALRKNQQMSVPTRDQYGRLNDEAMKSFFSKEAREAFAKQIYIPPHLDVPVASEKEQMKEFLSTLRSKNPNGQAPLRSAQAAIEWFKEGRKKYTGE
jgi:uncharacterized protein YoaH (UPF0181 family)